MMRKLFLFFIINFCYVIPSSAQNNSVREFYMYLNQVLEDKNIESIDLFETHYGCLGSKSYWDAILSKKGNKIEIKYYSHVAKDKHDLDVLVRRLDTVFTISKKRLIENFKNEIINSESNRRIILEGTYKLIIKTKNDKNEFLIKKVEGLRYILRYNKVYEEYFSNRLVNKRIKLRENNKKS